MCICCDIMNNRISKELAQKIIDDMTIRAVYDALRAPNGDGEPIGKIIAYFIENNWQSDAIFISSREWRTAIVKNCAKRNCCAMNQKNAL